MRADLWPAAGLACRGEFVDGVCDAVCFRRLAIRVNISRQRSPGSGRGAADRLARPATRRASRKCAACKSRRDAALRAAWPGKPRGAGLRGHRPRADGPGRACAGTRPPGRRACPQSPPSLGFASLRGFALRPGGAPCGACPPASLGGTRVRRACLRQAGAARPSPRFARLGFAPAKRALRSRSRLLASGLRPAARDGSTALHGHPGSRGASAPAGTLGYAVASPRSLAGRGKPPAKVAPPGGGVASARCARSATLRATGGSPRGRPSRLGARASCRAAARRPSAFALPRARSAFARYARGQTGTAPLRSASPRCAALRPCPAALRSCCAGLAPARFACPSRASFARALRGFALQSSVPSASRKGRPGAGTVARAVAMEARFAVIRPSRRSALRSRPGRCAASARKARAARQPAQARDVRAASPRSSVTCPCNSPPLRGRRASRFRVRRLRRAVQPATKEDV